ncbi:MAG TPA: PQQ-binding-like beta-propeller repeat protein, partial [Vicinamibacteria bacterium]|nr:PQQ-binding-like beta-propeller repeat protein [Vicinamibacteria bacterium]
LYLAHREVGKLAPQIDGNSVSIGPFKFLYDANTKTLSGTMPSRIVPVYEVPVSFHRVEHLELPERPPLVAPLASPVWTFDAGSPLWPGARFAEGTVYAGADDGRLHALDARSGRERWSFHAGGPIRTRPTVAGADVFFQADDGVLYRLDARTGGERWRVKVAEKPSVRSGPGDPKSRFDDFGADVIEAGNRLFVGTHDGRMLAVDPAQGRRVWEFAARDSVVAAPAVDAGRVFFGSFDGNVYALDAARGQLIWKHDMKAPVTSTPAIHRDLLLIGSRAYDFEAIKASNGETAWARYIWFSWVESTASVRDGVAYVGSSDAAALFAFDARSGRSLWRTDVYGWAWGLPSVTDRRVFVGTAAETGYVMEHRAGIVAVDRGSGRPVWRYEVTTPPAGTHGFPGSSAVGEDLVFFTGLDGHVYAFKQ